jgi:cytochrome b561
MFVVHEIFAWAVIALISLHADGALRHHFVVKDDVLRRMLPGIGG